MSRPAPLAGLNGGLFAFLFLVALFSWVMVLNVGAALYAGIVMYGHDGPELDILDVLFDPVVLGTATSIQLLGFVALALGFSKLRGKPIPTPWRPAPLVLALLAGASVGPAASFLAETLSGLGGIFSAEHLTRLAEAIANGSPLGRSMLLLAVCVLAPIGEELVFRGVLWDALAQRFPPVAVWLLTSGLFAAYHLDPLHMLSLAPTALLLGWMRYATGSVVPAIAAHFVNNAIGVAWIFVLGVDAETPVTAVIAAASTALAVGLCWALSRLRTPPLPG